MKRTYTTTEYADEFMQWHNGITLPFSDLFAVAVQAWKLTTEEQTELLYELCRRMVNP